MDDYQKVYSLFTFVNESSLLIGLINTIVSGLFGAWIVYYFNIRLERNKQKDIQKQNFLLLKTQILQTIEEYRIITSFIAEYQSKSEYQIKCRDSGLYFNENIYNVRVGKFDDFRIKFAEIRSKLLNQLKIIEQDTNNTDLIIDFYQRIENYQRPTFVGYDEIVPTDDEGNIILKETDIDKMVMKKLKNENELYWIVDKLKIGLKTIEFKRPISGIKNYRKLFRGCSRSTFV